MVVTHLFKNSLPNMEHVDYIFAKASHCTLFLRQFVSFHIISTFLDKIQFNIVSLSKMVL